MIKYFKQLTGDSLIYGISSVISGFISLFLVPVYTKIFTPSDYGILNLVNVTFYLLTIFVVFGLDSAVAVWFWDAPEEVERKKTFASWFWFQSMISGLLSVLIIIASYFLSRVILSNGDYYYLFIIAGINLPFLATHRVLINWYKYQRKAFPTVAFTLFISLLVIGLSILFVVVFRFGVKGVFIAQLIASIIGSIVVFTRLRAWLAIKFFDRNRLKEMLRFAAPLVPAALSFWALSNASSYVIENYASKHEVGLYQIGVTFAGFVNIVVLAFNQAWPPFALSISKQPDHRNVYANIFLFYISLGCVLATSLWIFAPEILHLLTAPSYYAAADIVGILGFNVFIMGIANITTIGCNLAKTNKPYAQAVFIASLLSVALYFVLIPAFGKEGAGWATLTGSVCLVAYVSYKANKVYPIPYNWGRTLLYIFLSGVVIFLSRYNPMTKQVGLGMKFLFLFLFLVVLALLNISTFRKIFAAFKASGKYKIA
jgi:O-antigen/teichoic acid export membrane protein